MTHLALAIVRVVAAEQGVAVKIVLSRSRSRLAVAARREVYRRLHAAGWSLSAIGREFDRDHSTVLHALAQAPTMPAASVAPDMRAEVADLTARVERIEAQMQQHRRLP